MADPILTFLFTDIERSSELWEKHPAAMGRALARHDALLRAASAAHGGRVFKTVGDAFCVAFAEPPGALRAALDAQRRLAAEAWGETGPLRVRMALHHGGAEARDGDYFGTTLNRVARVLAAGHGGQVLLSQAAADRVRAALEPGASLRDCGERRLKDLSLPERIFQLVVPDLPADFPPLRSLEFLPNNLPAQVTSFVGRAGAMAEVRGLLERTRLLTLTGPGGTGKTRLSLQVAAEMLDRFPQGVWLVELATVSDPALVAETIAGAVDLREEPGQAPLQTLLDALRSRQLLLILDNCEHLVAACAEIAATLLRHCPGLRILASSREPLGIAGEALWPVPALGVPDWHELEDGLDFEAVARLEAVQLFVERAAAVRPGFALTPENAPLLARICWRLDGIPLAIELAAARVKVLPLPQILARLDDRFRLLSGGSRAALPRQQTLAALIDWSYDLLSEPERILLRRLSVFVAGRTLAMAEQVCAGDDLPAAGVFDLLCALVEKSLLLVEPDGDGETRYTMLESIWDYAEEKLRQHGEEAAFRRRHLEFFVRFAEEAEPHLSGPDQKRWLERVAEEHFNLNQALRFSLERDETVPLGLRLAGAIARYWEVRSYLNEGYELFTRLLAAAPADLPPEWRAKAELGAGRLAWCQDRDFPALNHYRRVQELYRAAGDEERAATVEALMGYAERNEGHHEAAWRHFETAFAAGEKLASRRLRGLAINGLGSLAATDGDFARSRALKEEAIAIQRELGDLFIISLATGSLGEACLAAGDHPAARRHLREALALSRELGNKWSLPYALEGLADIDAVEGRALKAVRLYGCAAALREALALDFSATEHASYQEGLAQLHRLVPGPEFAREWEAGQALGLPAAVALAMAD